MTDPNEQALVGSLERQRTIFAWKCGGLDTAGLRATVGPSTMTLGGLLKHMALVEDEYFSSRLPGLELGHSVGHRRLGRRPQLGVVLCCR